MNHLLAVTVLWAFSFSLIGQYLAGQVDSDFAVLARVVIAAAIFVPLTAWRGVPAALWRGFWLAGALQFGVTYLCLYRSFNVLTVPEVLLFTVLTPIYITLLDDALARRFNRWAMLAALVAVTGGIIIRFEKIDSDWRDRPTHHRVWALAASTMRNCGKRSCSTWISAARNSG